MRTEPDNIVLQSDDEGDEYEGMCLCGNPVPDAYEALEMCEACLVEKEWEWYEREQKKGGIYAGAPKAAPNRQPIRKINASPVPLKISKVHRAEQLTDK